MDNVKTIAILGRQPALGIAELESLYGSVKPLGHHAAGLAVAADEVTFQRLGGSVKLCKLLTILDTTNWGEIERYLVKNTPEHAAMLPEGKLTIGLSLYGFKETTQRIQATGLSLKKAIKKSGRPIRLVPNQEPALNTAQVQHNKLAGELGWELVFVADNGKTYLAQTTASQDIDSYTLRDRSRPKRDSRVGMLPPKLAQIIINLATGDTVPAGKTVLDPFCGTGVVLQEALLMGFNAYGTDLEPRMIDYSGENLDWLDTQFELKDVEMRIEEGDATRHRWEPAPDVVACETYLGRPYTALPPAEQLNKNISDCNAIIGKFLRNISKQLAPGTRLCIAVPAWQIRKNQFKHLPLID
ncbi:MAG: TRM11 family SAM-dependent methyltransferase, partial [Candidatus Saccharimonadales bacterium]